MSGGMVCVVIWHGVVCVYYGMCGDVAWHGMVCVVIWHGVV